MGNCQAAQATVETLVILHPGYNRGGKVDRMYQSVSANEVMGSNPGYYVALVVQPSNFNMDVQNVKKYNFKLLKPNDTLHIGHVYRLISFEDVIKEFTLKKSMKLVNGCGSRFDNNQTERANQRRGSGTRGGVARGQWRPALQSIAEV